MTFYITLALCSFLISLLGTRLTILAVRKRTLFFESHGLPGQPRLSAPRGGGIAVVFALIIGLMVADINYGIVLSLLLLAAISLMDDLIGVSLPVRLLVEVLAVSIPLSAMTDPIWGGLFPGWLDTVMTGALWVWFMNMFNAMDKVDGMAVTGTIGIGTGLCLLTALAGTFLSDLSAYSLVMACTGCGFLWWNWPPAKISLSEVGSIPSGFLCGYVLILAVMSGYVFAAFILPAYVLADSAISLCQRLGQHKKVWGTAFSHYYQKAIMRGRSQENVVRYVFGTNLLLILLATLSIIDAELAGLYTAIAYMTVFMLLGFFAHSGPHADEEAA